MLWKKPVKMYQNEPPRGIKPDFQITLPTDSKLLILDRKYLILDSNLFSKDRK
jgi:hypothetical protein